MASSSRHRPNYIVKRPDKASDNPHFFKVVLSDALKEQKLEIPRKFVREYGQKAFVTNQTLLKVADGKEWNMGLTKSNNGRRVWFYHGWQQFVEFYSLGLGYFLVFKYENRSSSFNVVIFDLTAMEIEYPVKNIRLDKTEEKIEMEIYFDDDLAPDFKVEEISLGARKPMNSRWKPPSTESQRARAMAEATAFQSMTLNPSFMCKIWPSHIHLGRCLNVPKSFAAMHLEEPTEIILQVSDGRMWSGRCGFYWTCKMQRRTDFRYGWKNFVRDNNLKVGDFCVFEMIRKNSRRICFKVENFRAS
ncbi:B3 domain-containing transcription factor VRN1-like [Benincasa hispida]|uniref:B3 domain-containing transcription factor VRN1-like n=1 Tax=Benincasa hispida TaxID=102211 RepID=UPI0018FFF399|nr:B3 domain-containing transcription factor VRN1-like [Benincasa hispida]